MSASCSFPNRFRKEFLGHKMGTGAGGKVAAVFDQFQSFDIDLAVTFDSVFGGLAGFGKCRRIQDHDIVFLSCFCQAWKFVKYIRTAEGDPVFQSVSFCIFRCLGNGILRDIQPGYLCGSGNSGVQGECSHMGKTIQHPFSFTDALHRQTVVFLIQENPVFWPFSTSTR